MLSDILASLHELPTPLSQAFFSDGNIAAIQAGIIQQVKLRLGHTITDQPKDQVIIVMKFVYRDSDVNQYLDVASQVRALNVKGLNILTDLTITGIKQYLTYIRDSQNQPQPLPLPVMTSVAGTKLYRGGNPYASGTTQLPVDRPLTF